MAIDYFDLIAADSRGLADAAEGNLDAPVEHCPGWTVRDLVTHLLEVQQFWSQLVERRLLDPRQVTAVPAPTDDDGLLAAFRANAERTAEILRAADPSIPVWTWAAQKDVAFVQRHQVQEAAVHRWDAEHAAGHDFAIDRNGAIDAIEEFLALSLGALAQGREGLAGPLVLTVEDADRSWTITGGSNLTVTDGVPADLERWPETVDDGSSDWPEDLPRPAERPEQDAAEQPEQDAAEDADDKIRTGTQLYGAASELLLWLYRRVPTGPLVGRGTAADADRLRGYTDTT